MDVPIKVAVHYIHRFHTIPPDNKAEAKDLTGFIDAPDINAKKNMSNPTIAPITLPPKPLRPFGYTTTSMSANFKRVASID